MSNKCADQKEEEIGSCLDKRVERAQKLLEHLLAEMDSYHNHKESMAHAGLLIMLAIGGGILSLAVWPPEWIPPSLLGLRRYSIAFLGTVFLLVLCHIYIRWQLRYRRAAAIMYNGALLALAEWVRREPTKEDLAPYCPQKTSIFADLTILLDYIFPFPYAPPNYPIAMAHFPVWLANNINQEAERLRFIWSEWLVWGGSFIVFVIIGIRLYFNS